MVECAKSGIYRKLMFLEEFLYWFGGFINKIERDIAGARKIFADQPADLLEGIARAILLKNMFTDRHGSTLNKIEEKNVNRQL